jgi:hypothetical protein
MRAFDRVGNMVERSTTFTVDRTPPRILGFGPTGDDVALDEPVFISFSERMQKGSLQMKVTGASGDIVWRGERAVFEPRGDLRSGTRFNVTVTGTDLAGNPLQTLKWSFNTTIYGTVRGRIVTEEGYPVSGAMVILGDMEVESRPDGGFVIEHVNGTFEMTVKKSGYRTERIDINVTAGKLKELPDIVLRESKDEGIDLLALLMIPLAILLVAALAAVIGTLISRRAAPLDEE